MHTASTGIGGKRHGTPSVSRGLQAFSNYHRHSTFTGNLGSRLRQVGSALRLDGAEPILLNVVHLLNDAQKPESCSIELSISNLQDVVTKSRICQPVMNSLQNQHRLRPKEAACQLADPKDTLDLTLSIFYVFISH